MKAPACNRSERPLPPLATEKLVPPPASTKPATVVCDNQTSAPTETPPMLAVAMLLGNNGCLGTLHLPSTRHTYSQST